MYSAFYYWWRLKRRIVVLAVRAAVVVSLLLVSAWSYWPDEMPRLVVRTGNAVLTVTESTVRRLGVEDGGRIPTRPNRPTHDRNGQAEVLSGRARAVDGDTLDMNGVRVRLHGIDAPESAQTCIADGRRWRCGQRAASALAERISGRSVSCKEIDRDRYGRMVAKCSVGGKDLNAELVSEGWALAYRWYSTDYVDEQATARTAQRGVWRGRFVEPWNWREGVRLDSRRAPVQQNRDRTARPGASRCRIKGNISRKGARIYHVPGGRYYESTRISPSRGERWFCTEAEARAAGWRRSRR